MPVFRRREKLLTAQEAVGLAKRELLPYWIGSEPLFVGVRASGKATVYPLDPKLNDRPWLLLFADPSSLSARGCLQYARAWAARYEAQRLGVIVVLRLRYSYSRSPEWTRHWLGQDRRGPSGAPPILAMDIEGLLAAAFQVAEYPKLALFHGGQVLFSQSGRGWFEGSELAVQAYLRKADPGLPLFPALAAEEALSIDSAELDLGADASAPLEAQGSWAREGDRWLTSDPKATLSFRCQGKRLGLVLAGTAPDAEVLVELNREIGKETLCGQDLTARIQGGSAYFADARERCRGTVAVSEARLYRAFESLPPTHREVTLRFPQADRAPVAVHGLRFGD